MIVRSWSGRVPIENADGFATHLFKTGIADYRRQPGCLEIRLSRLTEGQWAKFTLTSVWRDMEAICAYSGSLPHAAVLYPGDEQFGLLPDWEAIHAVLVHSEGGLAP